MGLPFRNGAELAAALGYGDLYNAAAQKEKQETEENSAMTEGIKKMMNKMDEIFKRNIQDVID
jgi:hypothetical protein